MTGYGRAKIVDTECSDACSDILGRSGCFVGCILISGRDSPPIAHTRPDLELLIYGHSHVPALMRLPASGVYANAGSWLDAPTFLRATSERVELRRWDGSAEGLHLDALDRVTEKALA